MLISVQKVDGETVAFVPPLARPASRSTLEQLFPEAPKALRARHPEEEFSEMLEPDPEDPELKPEPQAKAATVSGRPLCASCGNPFRPRKEYFKYCTGCASKHKQAKLDALVRPKPVRPPPPINHRLEDERLREHLLDQYRKNLLPDGVTLTLNGAQVVLVAEVERGGVKMKRSFTFVDHAIKAQLERDKLERKRMADATARVAVAATRAAAAARKKEADANPSPKKDKSNKKGDKDKSKRK
jgi:hypothetical protein